MQEKDPIKEAFARVKEDVAVLKESVTSIQKELEDIKKIQQVVQQTNQHINQTENLDRHSTDTSPTHSSTDNLPFKALIEPYKNISTGNDGVSTDRQTNRQTDTSTGKEGVKFVLINKNLSREEKLTNIDKVANVLNSLDDLKKELRWSFKKLTNQEMVVFSAIYELEEKGFTVDYSLISQTISISESSVRDYIQRILKKGIPLQKTKENNKKIILSISPDLRKIASLDTINQLREL